MVARKKLAAGEKRNNKGSWGGAECLQRLTCVRCNMSVDFENAGKQSTPRPSNLDGDYIFLEPQEHSYTFTSTV